MMTKNKNQQAELREQYLAMRITALLDEQALNVDPKVASKLVYAREQAIANMVRPSTVTAISQNGVIRLFGNYWHQHRFLFTLIMCGLGLIALLAMKNMTIHEDVEQGDAYLLASDLPPEVYSNEGFGAWLSENTQQ